MSKKGGEIVSQPLIQIEHLNKTFASASGTVTALEDVSLTIEQGEIFGIIGMSGAGKSTLIRCMNILEQPTSGSVLLDGRDLTKLPKWELYRVRRSIGMIFQQFNLLMQRTALQNVCFPMELAGVEKADAKKRALELLELVGISDKAGAYPAQLSGGQRQRVAIARALATDAKVLLCDEATSALDPATTRDVLALLKDLNKRLGITIVVITHEMRVIEQVCHRVAILDNSRVVEIGRVSDVFANPKSAAARRLIYPDGAAETKTAKGRAYRVVFNGNSSFEPVIANMVLEVSQPVNILFADTKDIEGQAYGQMVLQLPESADTAGRMISYLRSRGLTVEEANAC